MVTEKQVEDLWTPQRAWRGEIICPNVVVPAAFASSDVELMWLYHSGAIRRRFS